MEIFSLYADNGDGGAATNWSLYSLTHVLREKEKVKKHLKRMKNWHAWNQINGNKNRN